VDLEHETIHLGFGEGIGPFLLDGVLRGQDQERVRQGEGLVPDRHLPLLHGFQERRLHLGRGAVHLVGQDDVGENRALLDGKGAVLGL